MARAPRTAANSSVDQVFGVLELAAASGEPVGVAEVARALAIPTSTAHRVLNTLVAVDYLAREPGGARYQLGVMAQELAEAFFARFPLRDAGAGHLRRLVSVTGQTTTLSVRFGWYELRIAGLAGWREIHAAPEIGRALPLDDTLAGQVLLAALDDTDVEAFLRWRGGRLSCRDPARAALGRRLDRARADVVTGASHAEQTAAVALAIRDEEGRARAVFTIEGAPDDHPAGSRRMLARCRAVVDELEGHAAMRPRLLADPHGRVPREAIAIAMRTSDRTVSWY